MDTAIKHHVSDRKP